MTNRTDWEELAKEIVQTWLDEDTRNLRVLRDRIETELHNAYVAGQEGSPEVWAQFGPIVVHADDPDRLAFELIDAFTKKVTGEMAIPTDFGPLTMSPTNKMAFTKNVIGNMPNVPVCACGDPKCGQPHDAVPAPVIGGPPGGPGEIGGLTPGECRDRWEENAAAIESGMARPWSLSPDQIAEGKRLHVAARKAGR